ncbi:MAG: crossover junction endodeoxyribonuclease RuvC, partial [Candidatus Competibacter sp.]
MTTIRLMGIDPGSRITGYGIIDWDGPRSRHVASGCIQTASDRPVPERLKTIYEAVAAIIQAHRPMEVAVEQVFMH